MSDILKMIIGGSASTGSSLLAQMLNRHSHIFCGPETNIITNVDLIENWKKFRNELLVAKRKSHLFTSGWHVHRGHQLLLLADVLVLQRAVDQSDTYRDFIQCIFEVVCSRNGKKCAIEKTPSNSLLFDRMRSLFPKTRFLLTVRDPYDCIASMINRGWSVVYATGLYLFNISMGNIASDRFKTLKYEDLAADPQGTLEGLMDFVGLPYEPAMIRADKAATKMESWRFSETDAVRNAEGTFANLSRSQQREVKCLVASLQFKKGYEFQGIRPKYPNISEMMNEFHYESRVTRPNALKSAKNRLKRSLLYEKIKRGTRRSAIGYFNFPFELNDKL